MGQWILTIVMPVSRSKPTSKSPVSNRNRFLPSINENEEKNEEKIQDFRDALNLENAESKPDKDSKVRGWALLKKQQSRENLSSFFKNSSQRRRLNSAYFGRQGSAALPPKRGQTPPGRRIGKKEEGNQRVSPEIIDLGKIEVVKKLLNRFYRSDMKIQVEDDVSLEKIIEWHLQGTKLLAPIHTIKPRAKLNSESGARLGLPCIDTVESHPILEAQNNKEADNTNKTDTKSRFPEIFNIVYSDPNSTARVARKVKAMTTSCSSLLGNDLQRKRRKLRRRFHSAE